MTLQEQIQSDMTAAMKARDKPRLSALRMVVAEMKNTAVDNDLGPQGELPDDAVERILAKETKRRREAAEAYRDAGREEKAAAEEAEAEVYATYLPEPLDDDELLEIVQRGIDEVGAEGPQDMGQVMGTVMSEVGNRADGQRVSAMVKSRLLS